MNQKALLVQSLGIILFSPALLWTSSQAVLAEENYNSNETSSNSTNSQPASLDKAISEAKDNGLTVVELESKYFLSPLEIQIDNTNQANAIQETTQSFIEDKKIYDEQARAYQNYLSELNQYETDIKCYNQEQENYNKQYETYVREEKDYQDSIAAIEIQETNYQNELAIYTQASKDYETYLKNSKLATTTNQTLKEQFDQALIKYQQELETYKKEESLYIAKKEADLLALETYEKALANYHQDLKEYELEEKAYEEKLNALQAMAQNDGHLSQAYAQYLIFKSEPNANVTIEGTSTFIASSHNFGGGLDGIGAAVTNLPLTSQPSLSKEVGGATPAGPGDGYGLILEKNHPISVIYTGLKNSSYNGRKIDKVVYTYELTSTFAPDGKAAPKPKGKKK